MPANSLAPTRQFSPERLREARESKGLTQESLGGMLAHSVTGSSVSKWESGEETPRSFRIDDLAQALEKPKDFFFISRTSDVGPSLPDPLEGVWKIFVVGSTQDGTTDPIHPRPAFVKRLSHDKWRGLVISNETQWEGSLEARQTHIFATWKEHKNGDLAYSIILRPNNAAKMFAGMLLKLQTGKNYKYNTVRPSICSVCFGEKWDLPGIENSINLPAKIQSHFTYDESIRAIRRSLTHALEAKIIPEHEAVLLRHSIPSHSTNFTRGFPLRRYADYNVGLWQFVQHLEISGRHPAHEEDFLQLQASLTLAWP